MSKRLTKKEYLKRKKLKAKIKQKTNQYFEQHYISGVTRNPENGYFDPTMGMGFPAWLMLMAARRNSYRYKNELNNLRRKTL